MTEEQLEKGKNIQQRLKNANEMKQELESSEYRILIQIKKRSSSYDGTAFNQHPTTKPFFDDATKHIRAYFLGIVDSEIKTLEEQFKEI